MSVVGARRGALARAASRAMARVVVDSASVRSVRAGDATTTATTTRGGLDLNATTIGASRASGTRAMATKATKATKATTGKAASAKTTTTTRAASGAKKTSAKTTKAGAASAKTKKSAKTPPAGALRTVPHASAAKFPLHESVLKDARGYRLRQYRMVDSRRFDEAALATADAGARRSGKITLTTAKAIVKSVQDGGARWGVTQTERDTIRFVMNGGGGSCAYKTEPAARKFLEEFVTKAEEQAAAAAAAAPSVAKAKARVETFTPPPTTANRVMPHAAAAKFPLHESILHANASTQAAKTVLREPLSTPIASASSSSPPPPPPPSQDGQGSSRTTILAAVGAVLAALLAYSMGGVDEEDRPPPPQRKKSPPARKDVEVKIEIVKQPDDAPATQTKKPVQKKEAQTEKVEAKEVADAFGATADFLSKIEPAPAKEETKKKEPEVLAKVNIPKPERDGASIMDAGKDLSAASLIEEAMKTLADSLSDEEKQTLQKGMKVQAESDARVFKGMSSSMRQNFENVVATERAVTDELVAAINVLETRAEDTARELEREKERAVAEQKRALEAQETKLKAEHADFLVAERIERIRALDNERLRVGALRQVLTKRRQALERAHDAQRFELAVMDLGTRLETGEAFKEALVLLKSCSKTDPFIATIIDGVDDRLAQKGVKTRLQLAEQLLEVRETARKLSLVPQDGGGMFAHGLSYAASLLRVKDTSDEGAQGIEGAIAKADSYLASGELMLAAQALTNAAEGTKAASSVHEWVQNVRARAQLEQAQTALSAHAQCRASALV